MPSRPRRSTPAGAPEPPVDAGPLAPWAASAQVVLRTGGTADVPCDGCVACCTSSQFVHIGPDEADTLAHVPAALRAQAPGLPPGHVVLGYDERGHCPMLVDGACSIYEHRPRTCRVYDCRVFAAAGTVPDGRPLVAARVRRWRFALDSAEDRARHGALRAALAFLAGHPDLAPPDPGQRAVTALAIHDLFVDGDVEVDPDPAHVRRELARRRAGA